MTPCPGCGASNAASASWCTQCFAALGSPTPAAPPVDRSAERAPEPPTAADPSAQPADATAIGDAAGVRRGPDGLEWVCVACETVNPMAASVCGVCAVPFTARFASASTEPDVDWSAARTVSLIAPGLGHIRAGAGASGIARLVLFTVWAIGALAILVSSGAAGLPVGGPLLLGAVIIHVLTQRDLAALRGGGRQVLEGRVLLWLVVGVTGLLLAGAVVGVGGAATGVT